MIRRSHRLDEKRLVTERTTVEGEDGAGTAPPEGAIRDRSGAEVQETSFRVGDMDCPSCVATIERHLEGVDGVVSVRASVVARNLSVFHTDATSPRRLADEVGRLGYHAHPLDPGADPTPTAIWRSRQARITYTAIGLFTLGVILALSGASPASHPVFFLAALVGGANFFGKGVRSALRLALDMNFLMTVAIIGALILGETLEAAAIAFLFSTAELLEGFAVERARASIAALKKLAPDSARMIRGTEEVVVSASALVPGDQILVRPGDRIPADGRVVRGWSTINQAPITGESLPVDKGEGDAVLAGTINGDGELRVEVEKPASESTLARIGRMIQEAESLRARSERFVERFAAVYTPTVTGAAVLVAILPPLLFGAPAGTWVLRGLTLLVIACPCALVISTPVAVVSGVTAAARRGVLIKGGVYLETVGQARVVAFDKTGTLTLGHPRVMDVRPETGVDRAHLLKAAAAVEAGSTHPIARAIVDAASEAGIRIPPTTVTDARAHPGLGASARVEGVETAVGRPGVWTGASIPPGPPEDLVERDATVVGVSSGGEFLGWIAIADDVRVGSRRVVEELKSLGVEKVVMLTGDTAQAAEAIGRATGVDEVRAGLMPEEKVAAIRELSERWGEVVMVGDGVNDGPALAASSVGIAMGAAGSDVALETADVALLGDEVRRLPYLMRLSRRARRVIRQNVWAAILVKAVLALGVPLGLVSLVTAVVVGDMGVSLAVIVNALRLGRVEA